MLFLRKPNVFRKLPSFEQRGQPLQLHTHARTYPEILYNNNNLLYHSKCGICIYKKTYITTVYTKVLSTILIKYSKFTFNLKAFEVSIYVQIEVFKL